MFEFRVRFYWMLAKFLVLVHVLRNHEIEVALI